MTLEIFSLKEVLDSVIKDVEGQPDLSIDISFSDLPVVKADKIGLREAFLNFVTNAHKYNDSENKQVNFSFDKDSGILSISDNGIGIEQKDYDAVFAFFRRVHGKDEYGGGSGAGLAIVKKILERQGISIGFESEVGKGTTFMLDMNKVLV